MAASAKVVMGVVALGVGAMLLMGGKGAAAANNPQPSIGPEPTSWRQLNSWEITPLEQAQMNIQASSLANGAATDMVLGGKWRRFQNASGTISIWAPSSEPLNGSPPPTGVQPQGAPTNTVPAGGGTGPYVGPGGQTDSSTDTTDNGVPGVTDPLSGMSTDDPTASDSTDGGDLTDTTDGS
jgi:hypothetical protein